MRVSDASGSTSLSPRHTVESFNMVIHGQKFGTKNRTKCGKWLGKLNIKEEACTATYNVNSITCMACRAAHRPGKV